MVSQAAVFARKKAPLQEGQQEVSRLLSLLSFVTLLPVGNPLRQMDGQQRKIFFDVLQQMAVSQAAQNRARDLRITSNRPAAVASALPKFELVQKKQADASGMEKGLQLAGAGVGKGGWQAEEKKSPPAPAVGEEKGGHPAGAASPSTAISLPMAAALAALSPEIFQAQQALAREIDDYARGDPEKASAALSEFKSRVETENFKSEELMAVLLLVIEDQIWEGGEPGVSGAGTSGSGIKVQRNPKRAAFAAGRGEEYALAAQETVPQKLRDTARDSAEVRLASVREMLRYYFQRHPKDYAIALAAALGITSDQEGDQLYMQERLASCIASIGGFALAQKVLAELKEKKRMDTKKCLLELGYHYNAKKKRLVVGKRTCGKPLEARGIIGFLLSMARK